jgi:hypothetical protein
MHALDPKRRSSSFLEGSFLSLGKRQCGPPNLDIFIHDDSEISFRPRPGVDGNSELYRAFADEQITDNQGRYETSVQDVFVDNAAGLPRISA